MASVRLFVIWDSTIEQIQLLLSRLEKGAPGVEVSVIGRDHPAGTPSRLVAAAIAQADVCVALLDQANANVGWEIGFALGAGKPVRLVTAHGPATWATGAPLDQELIHPGLMKPQVRKQLFAHCAEERWFQHPGRKPRRGKGSTLLLCPSDPTGETYAETVADLASWERPDTHRWPLGALGEVLDGVRRVVWVVPQPVSGAPRDTPETAQLAVLAGYAKAVGLDVVALCQECPRKVLDLWEVRRPFTTPEDFNREIQRLTEEQPGVEPDLLTAYRRDLHAQTSRLTPFLERLRSYDLPGVYVPLDVVRCLPADTAAAPGDRGRMEPDLASTAPRTEPGRAGVGARDVSVVSSPPLGGVEGGARAVRSNEIGGVPRGVSVVSSHPLGGVEGDARAVRSDEVGGVPRGVSVVSSHPLGGVEEGPRAVRSDEDGGVPCDVSLVSPSDIEGVAPGPARAPSSDLGSDARATNRAQTHPFSDASPEAPRPSSLHDLLDRGGQWALVANPGAGKTTTLRHLVHELAASDGVLALHVPLYAWATFTGDVFAFAEHHANRPGLADRLRESACKGRIWLLLDGLDEVPGAGAVTMRHRLEALARDHAHVPTVVAGRPEAFTAGLAGYERVALQDLTPAQQDDLLDRLAPGVDLKPAITRRPMLANLARNPLMLTLIALTARAAVERGDPLPVNRVDVYAKATRLLLDNTFSPDRPKVKDVDLAVESLQRLAFSLMGDRSQVWALGALTRRIAEAWAADEEHKLVVQAIWDAPRLLLEDIERGSGLIGRHDGPSGGWRWLHRSLGEWLAAEEAKRRGPAAWKVWERAWSEDEDGGTWGEAFGLLCGLVPDRAAFLRALAKRDRALAVRAMLGVDGLDPRLVAKLWSLAGQEPGDDLAAALELTGADPAALTAALWGWVRPEADATTLGFVWDVLDQLGAPPDREAFFRACARPLPGGWRPATCRVPAGGSWRGSPEGVGHDNERPRHRVMHPEDRSLTTTPITNAAYRRLWPDHDPGAPDDHPAVHVSWYAARLYAAWLGGELPTEAQWEHACRAGTDTAYSFGDDPGALGDHAWFDKNSGATLHPVGEKRPNPGGLHDMHGLVWEWCADSDALYEAVDAVDPCGPRRGFRCRRGGAFRNGADWCHSASRSRGWPTWSYDFVGLRVMFPAPAEAG